MKTIVIHIDEVIFEKLKKEAALLSFTERCVAPPSTMERIMQAVIIKMENGETEMTVVEKKRTGDNQDASI